MEKDSENLENVFLQIMKQLSDEQKSPLEVATDIVERTAMLVNADVCTWFRVTSDRQRLVLAAAYGPKGDLVPTDLFYDLPWDEFDDAKIKGLTAWIAVRGEEFSSDTFPQLRAHKSHRGVWDEKVWGHIPVSDLKSWFGVPLRLGEDATPKQSVIGVLKVERSVSEPFTDHDKYIVRLMARYISISLEYRDRIVAKFLQQLGHPLWGAIATIMNMFRDSYNLSSQIQLQDGQANHVLLESLKENQHSGLVHTQFVHQSMEALKELVLGSAEDRSSAETAKECDVVSIAQEIIKDISDLVKAQRQAFPQLGDFKIALDCTSDKISATLTEAKVSALRAIITELLYNAVKHARTGEKALLSITSETYLNIEVRDYGKGIQDEALSHIFDIGFYTRPDFAPEGVGCGLPMIRSVCQKFGWLNPEVQRHQQGASFIIRMPN
jgi:signal transduction histidine kinase